MKKLAIAALALVVSTAAHAQFESGKQYIGASMTGLNLSYNGSQDLNLGIQAKAGYFVEDDWMLLGQVEYNHSGLEGVKDYFSVGAQGSLLYRAEWSVSGWRRKVGSFRRL